jgi:hypothetical protein
MKNTIYLWGLGTALLAGSAVASVWFLHKQHPETPGKPAPPPAEYFHDVTEAVGIDFVHDAGPVGNYLLREITGSGGALFDYDGDDRLDLYLVQNGGPKGPRNRLYHQRSDGTFEDVSKGSGLDVAGHNMGVAVGDINNDGRPDVLLTQYKGIKLFLNEGSGTFRDVTREAGLDNPAWATSAAFLDYDRDGRLDLVVANYVDFNPSWTCNFRRGTRDYCSPNVFPSTISRLFHNVSPPGSRKVHFEDVTLASGLGRRPGPGLGVHCADFDGDGWIDILIANDGKPNHLWINQHNGTFTEQAARRGIAYGAMAESQSNMGIALGDVDGNGMFDIFITHLTSEAPGLWMQGPRGVFLDRAGSSGVLNGHWRGTGFGVVLADFDHDGALDLAVANGRVSRAETLAEPALGSHWGYYAERNQLFAGDGKGRFRDLSLDNPALCGTANVARGLAWGDVNNDGALDLLVTTAGGRARLYFNQAPNRGHWLMVRARDPRHHRDAYGAEIRVKAGKHSWQRLVNPGDSYLCSSDPRTHFGLGTEQRLESLPVRWPDDPARQGEEFVLTEADHQVDRPVVVERGKGRVQQKESRR